MPYQVTFEMLPVGYAASAKKRDAETADVSTRGFLSSEDGDLFITLLEGFPNHCLALLPKRVPPSTVDHMLAIVRADKTATVYVNEIQMRVKVQVKRSLKAGEAVFKDDIADVERLGLPGIKVPADAGVVFFFSVGWRRGLFYDLLPVLPKDGVPRDYDLEVRLGQLYQYLEFQEVYKITEPEWRVLVGKGWFPFVALKASTVKEMIAHVRNDWDVDDLLSKIAEEVRRLLATLRERWSTNRFFSPHYDVLRSGLDRYEAGDYVSAISVLTPKVEGILRGFGLATGTKSLKAQQLTSSAVRRLQQDNPDSLLFPRRFRKYVDSLHFGSFNAETPEGASRHTVAHGVAPPQAFTEKQASIIILVLDQFAFFLGRQANSDSDNQVRADG
ncbi:MAG TPA: hypothetical protein VM487_21145 [Phycisphaerae bacterium]|nr:hypothetical protein [Phycisphaerae bacterium]